MRVRIVPARQAQLLAARRAGADEDGVEALLQQPLHALDGRVVPNVHAHVQDVVDFLPQHFGGQAELRNVRPHEAARPVVLLEDRDLVAEGHEVAGDSQRRGARAHAGDPLPVLLLWDLREAGRDIASEVGGDALEAADRDWLVLDPAAPAGGLAGAVARPAEDAREDVRLPVEHVGVVVPLLGDEADVARYVGVSRAGPLAIHDLVVVVGILDVRWLHRLSSGRPRPTTPRLPDP